MLTIEKFAVTGPDVYARERVPGPALGEPGNIHALLRRHCPGLIPAVREVIESSEFQYCGGSREESFLWQHTVYVASMAMGLARRENVDPLLPVITALFHDCGKFENGKFHAGKQPEEVLSAEISQVLMRDAGFPAEDRRRVRESLLALHSHKEKGDINTCIVSDADFLIKSGYMGFANFFEKSVLRGMAIRNSILKVMSKELTYAASLETRMFTRSGKNMARKKSATTVSLFRNYLEELRITGVSDYEIRRQTLNWGRGTIRLILVLPRFCDHCWNPMAVGFDRKDGLKRDRLVVNIDCPVCSRNSGYDFSFCPPEVTAA